MKQLMVRYKVKADRVDENEAFIRKVFEQLDHDQPTGLRYASFKLSDGLSFMHLVSIETPDASNPLTEMSAFKAFTAQIKDRCDEPPAVTELNTVDSYRLVGA